MPRQGITAAWRDQLLDACNVHGCSRLLDEAEPPAFDAVLAQTPPTCDLQTARQLHQMATDEWRVENTVLYHVLRGSITQKLYRPETTRAAERVRADGESEARRYLRRIS